jgi:glycosyltransferase involved in cell wall biosynthesis
LSSRPPLKRLARGALRRPRSILQALRTRKLAIAIRLVDGRGPGTRRATGRVVQLVSGAFIANARTAAVGIPLHALGLRWAVSAASASAYALETGVDADTPPVAARRLVRISRETGDRLTAVRILDARPEEVGVGPSGLALRAEIDWTLGRYRRALEAAERVLEARPGDRDALRIRARSQAELTVLDSAWRPPLSGAAPRARGRATAPPERVRGRILHLLTNALPYRQAGYTVRSHSVALCQIEAGLEPRMATRAGFPGNLGHHGAPAEETVEGVIYHRLEPDLDPGTPTDLNVTRYAEAAARLIGELRPSLLQPATNHVNAQVALALRERFGVPVVYEVRGFQEESWLARFGDAVLDSDRYFASRAVETACMTDADAVVTLSETMRTDIIGRGVDPERILVVPNAVDVERFIPGPRDERLATSLGIGSESVVGYITTLWRYEGIEYLIEATAELKRRGRRLRCLIVGDGEVRAALEATAARLGLLADRTVIFTGRVEHDRVSDYYRLIDVFVVPRTNDRVSQLVTPLKPYEAMAMERALLVSGVGALVEIVDDGETGRTFVPEDASSLADTLEALLDDPAERRRLGRNAREWVATHRTWTANGRRYRELFERLGVA